MTRQEYFVYLGLLKAMSFYPKFSQEELFSAASDVRRAKFIIIPILSNYMTHKRFKAIRKRLTFSRMLTAREMADCVFWKVSVMGLAAVRQEVRPSGLEKQLRPSLKNVMTTSVVHLK